MSGATLVVLVLATAGIVEVWRHGSLFAEMRAELECRQDRWWAQLLLCGFCLSHWVALAVVVVYAWTAAPEERECLGSGWRIGIYAFAVTRGANLLNDLAKRHCRSPDQRHPPATGVSSAMEAGAS